MSYYNLCSGKFMGPATSAPSSKPHAQPVHLAPVPAASPP
nr:MAG TPA: hypothetical protein [Caudoviricetes sp.]